MFNKTHEYSTKFESINLHARGLNGGLKPNIDLTGINKTEKELAGKKDKRAIRAGPARCAADACKMHT